MGNRVIKESIRTSKSVNSLSDFQFRVWLYLITYVDDYGRGSADPELLKGIVFPRRKGVTEQQIQDALEALANKGMITLYEADEELYFYFPKWGEHQRVRQKVSKFPEPQQISSAAGMPPQPAATGGETRPEYNPIQSNTNTNSNSNTKARARECDSDPAFSAFWAAYPRKSGDIKSAYLEYLHVMEGGIAPETLIEAIKKQTDGASSEDLHFLPGAEKWLRNRGWESKAAIVSPKKGKSTGFTPASESKPAAPVDMAELDRKLSHL